MKSINPPVAARKPKELTLHNHTRIDPYFWLREKTSPEVIEYLEAENEYTEQVMAHTKGLQEKLYEEMVGRIQETDSSAPVSYGGYLYYTRTEKGKQYSIQCRKKGDEEAPEQILLDLNKIAKENNYNYLRLGVYKISPNHKTLAYSLDTDGAEDYTIYFQDMETGETHTDRIKGTSYSLEWANDNKTIFYSTQDEAKRSDKLWRHCLGTNQDDDELIHHEEDELFNLYLGKTRDHKYFVLTLGSIETTESHILEADSPHEKFSLIHPRETGLRYYLDHHEGTFYIVTNADDSKNNKIMATPTINPEKGHWKEYIPHRADVKIDGADLFKKYMVVYERENGLRTIKVIDFTSDETHYIKFPEEVYTYYSGSNPEFNASTLRIHYTSLTTADSTIQYNLNTKEWTVVKMQQVLGGYDPENYETERIWAEADDGIKVPISLVYLKETERNGDNPCILYGYGSYGSSVDPAFNSSRLSLVDRGFVFAIAHVRGGGELGRQWYEDGKFLNKKNTFTDFIACARHLIAEQYTNPEKLVAIGRSAGGLLMGAITNMAPELFKAVVAGVPFVDVVSTMLDESIPLTVSEFEEWGNPQDQDYYNYMLSYSPYDNVEAKNYPNLLVTAGLNDPRVQYWEPAKWVAKLRTIKTDNNKLIMKTFMGAGHFSSSGRYDYLKDTAFEYAFILDVFGVER
jgi:oligopeptidase B